ncbi:MAG: hypothetical protein U5N85_07975 [Arcicella sp.]|nr:hypothetical protein [Arcicella sp.]
MPGTGYTDFGARWYDNAVPGFTRLIPLCETSRRFQWPFTYGNNNPIRFIDPDGMASEGFEYSNGYTTSNSKNETGAVSHEGTFLNADGGGGDKPKVNTKPTATYAAGAAAMAQRTGISTVAEGGAGALEGWGASGLGRAAGSAVGVVGSFLWLMLNMEGDTPRHIDIPIDVTLSKSKKEEYITLYRGVSESAGAYYAAAKRGIAVPKGLSSIYSHSIPDDHTMGDNYSIWTSWSEKKYVAESFSAGTMGIERGVILQKSFPKSMLMRSGLAQAMGESEWLVPGVVTGAKVSNNKFSSGKK